MQDRTPGAARAALLTVATVVVAACCALAAGAVAKAAAHPLPSLQSVQPAPPVPPLVIEAVAVDRKGAPVTDLRAAEFDVTVDGRPRRGLSLAMLFRGPGAVGVAAAHRVVDPGESPPRAEPSRVVILLADQGSFLPGDDRRAQAVAETCLGLLGLADGVMFLRLPDLAGTGTLSVEREEVRQALQHVRALRGIYLASVVPTLKAPADRASGGVDRVDEPSTATQGAEQPPQPDLDLEELLRGVKTPESETLSPPAAKAHATDMLRGIRDLLNGLRTVPGGKTILLLSAGLVLDEVETEFAPVETAAAAAFTRIYTIQVPTASPRFADLGRAGLQALAEATGGTFVPLTSRPAQTLQRLATEMSFAYLIMLAPEPGDPEAPIRRISVKSRRKDVTLRFNPWLRPGYNVPDVVVPPAPPPPTSLPPAAQPPATPGANTAAGAPPRPARRDPAVDAVMARVFDYMANYGRGVSALVAEEVYEQKVVTSSAPRTGTAVKGPTARRLVSDFLLAKPPGAEGWVPFRDVFEVDGVRIRDRDDRLKKLFLDAPPEQAVKNAQTIFGESARYNIGPVERTLNIPTLALALAQPTYGVRFTYTKRGETTENGVRLWEIEYRETGRPTVIRSTAGGDLAASGSYWVEPASGRIVRTLLRAAGITITVTYEPRAEALGMWVPVRMQESYSYPGAEIRATATYSNFRRFQVFTEEQIKPPKHP